MDNEFEKMFIEFVTNKIEEKNISHSDFARQVYPGRTLGTAERIWRQLRNPAKDKPPRRLSLSEAYKMSQVLGSEFPALIWQTDQYKKQKQVG